MKIEMLNSGWMSAAAKILRQGDEPETVIRFPVPAYLVETGDERIFVNTGLHPGSIADPGAFCERPDALGGFTPEQERAVSEQVDVATLTRIGGCGNKTKTAAYRQRVSRDRIDEEAPR